jgi:glycerophosphoryl diester phosphodiesterase
MTAALLLAAAAAPHPGAAIRPMPFVRPFLRDGHKFVVCAHRGNHVEAPENTLDAIQEALRLDVDFIELDLRLSADGEIFVLHDGSLDRTTTGTGPAGAKTLAELKALTIKGARRPGEKIPTFRECLAVMKGRARCYMDIKAVAPAQVVPILREMGMEDQVIAYVYGAQQRDLWRRQAPQIPIISDLNEMKSPAQIEADWKAGPFAITDGRATEYTREFIQRWHWLGVAVIPDIQNPAESPAQWQPLIDAGVDGFQTDHPEAMIKHLKEQGIR